MPALLVVADVSYCTPCPLLSSMGSEVYASSCCSDKIATDCLRQANWTTEVAIELFYSSGLQASAALDTGAIEKLFLHYKGGQLPPKA